MIVDAEIGQREGATIAASNSMLRQLEVILPPTWVFTTHKEGIKVAEGKGHKQAALGG